jgi:hypothetical protein
LLYLVSKWKQIWFYIPNGTRQSFISGRCFRNFCCQYLWYDWKKVNTYREPFRNSSIDLSGLKSGTDLIS